MPTADDFYIEEYKAMRAQIMSDIEAARRVERLAAIAVTGIYTYIALNSYSIRGRFMLWLPVIIVVVGALRTLTIFLHTREIAGYVARLEDVFADGTVPGGWENHLLRTAAQQVRFPGASVWAWGALLTITLCVRIFGPHIFGLAPIF